MRRPGDIAHDNGEGGALCAMGSIDIAHRDRRIDRRPEAAAGDLADRRAAGIDNRRAIARRGAAVRTDAGPLARGSFRELPQHRCGTGETAFGAPPFADRPGEPGFDRCRGFIDIMTVEAQPGLEAPRLASAGPERRY